jgi:hypothetical protein
MRLPSDEGRLMAKKLIPLILAGLLLVPASASASELSVSGWCVMREEGVSLRARTFSYDYSLYAPYTWVYRYRYVGETTWYDADDLGFRIVANVISGGNSRVRFTSLPVPAEGMVYRLDLIYNDGFGRFDRVAHYNDETMTDEDCRHPA